jgi:prepilin-type N-terminal cleavage/methylation domain-containing protein
MQRSDVDAGFTLIEVLAALAVTAALVAVALPFAGRLAARWWVRETTVEAADALMQAIARLSDDLSQAVPLSSRQGDVDRSVFSAASDYVQFVRPAIGRTGVIGLETVRYEIRGGAGGDALVRKASDFAPDSALEPGSPTTILDGYRFSFRTYAEDRVLRSNWVGAEEMPAGVELSIRGKPNTARLRPMLFPITASTVRRP